MTRITKVIVVRKQEKKNQTSPKEIIRVMGKDGTIVKAKIIIGKENIF